MKSLANHRSRDLRVTLTLASFLCLQPILLGTSASAVDPHRLISQYGHTAWRDRDGFASHPLTITQTHDGYIWIGTFDGIVRFDGIKFSRWTPPQGQSLPSQSINGLLGGSDGSLWIGTSGGLSHFKDNQLFNYTGTAQPSPGIAAIIEDHTGAIWVTRYRINDGKGPLCRVSHTDLTCYGKEEGIPVNIALGITEDSAGNIWFGCRMLCRWTSGALTGGFFKEQLLANSDGVWDIAAGPSGSMWVAIEGIGPKVGLQYYFDGKWASYVIPGLDGSAVRPHVLFADREHTLWIGTFSQGLYHIHDGIADHYASADGLSGNYVASIYEDREGNLWTATDRGIDLFRDTPVVTYSAGEGLPVGTRPVSVLASSGGAVWIGGEGGLNTITNGRISTIAARQGLPGQDVSAMFEDDARRMWLGVDDKLLIYQHGRFLGIRNSDGSPLGRVGIAQAFAEDSDANIWALVTDHGSHPPRDRLLRVKSQRVEEIVELNSSMPICLYLVADRESGVWVGSLRDRIAHYHSGRMEIVSLPKGDHPITITNLLVDSDGAVLVTTTQGLYRWDHGRVQVMDSRNGLPCSSIFDAIKDNYGSFWLYARCGLLEISASELQNWLTFPERGVSVRTFDAFDGVLVAVGGNVYQPQSSKSTDGRLWFVRRELIQMLDPSHSYRNTVPPPVHVEGLVVGRRNYDIQRPLRLPPLRGELEIDYTALSFMVPQKVSFRYKLEGRDVEWQEPGTRRQAFYNDLPPGKYRFRVIASNNDGVWNEEGATLDFAIAPAWYQTNPFRLLCVASGFLGVWALYSLRVRRMARVMSARFDDRLAERTRMARDLHDTLLQTIHGSKLVADEALDASTDLPGMRRSMEQLSMWLGKATEEGRAALNSLRSSTEQRNDLGNALQNAIEECRLHHPIEASLAVIGNAAEMHPIVRDEAYRVAYEAIRNACVHSKGTRLEVCLDYSQDLTVRVKDNGVGIDPAVVEKGKQGHFGLQGMRERAARIGSKFTVVSSPSSGTEITVVVPGRIVFRKAGKGPIEKITNMFRGHFPASHSN